MSGLWEFGEFGEFITPYAGKKFICVFFYKNA